jgi:hypothetical protein
MSEEWLASLQRKLSLPHRNGRLLLVQAPDFRLREALLALFDTYPTLEAYSSVEQLQQIEPGATLLLYVQREEFEWLTMRRGFFRERRLTVILWASESVAHALRQTAFDFLDMISHTFEAPESPAPFLVANLKAAVTRCPRILWEGPPFGANPAYRGVFEAASPTQPSKWCNARETYREIKRQVTEAEGAWLFCYNIETPLQLKLLEAAIDGLTNPPILIFVRNPKSDSSQLPAWGWWPAYREPISFIQGRKQLSARGLHRSGRLAALTGLERESLIVLEALLALGFEEAHLEEVLRKSEDPGVALAHLGPMPADLKNLAVLSVEGSPLALRAFAEELSIPPLRVSREELASAIYQAGLYFSDRYDGQIGYHLLQEAREYSPTPEQEAIINSSSRTSLDPQERIKSATLPRDFYEAAEAFLLRGEYESALAAYQEAVTRAALEPADLRLRYYTGQMRAQRLLGAPEDALATYELAAPLINEAPLKSVAPARLQWERGLALLRAKRPGGFAQMNAALEGLISVLGEDSEEVEAAIDTLQAFYQMSNRASEAAVTFALDGKLLAGGAMTIDWLGELRTDVKMGGTNGKRVFLSVEATTILGEQAAGALLGKLWLHALLLHPSGLAQHEARRWHWAAEIVVNGVLAKLSEDALPIGAVREPALEGKPAEEVYLMLEEREPPLLPTFLLPPADTQEALRERWSNFWQANLKENDNNQAFLAARRELFLLLKEVGGGYLQDPSNS